MALYGTLSRKLYTANTRRLAINLQQSQRNKSTPINTVIMFVPQQEGDYKISQ